MPTSGRQIGFALPLLTLATLLASACAPAGQQPAPSQQGAAAPAQSAGPKTLVVGQGFEFTGLNRVGRNDAEIGHLLNAGLVTRNTEQYQVLPWMAEELPSLEKGTWQVDPGGNGMTTTWRVRPNIKWHDGTPFSTRDFIFGWQVMSDPKFEADSRGFVELMDRLEAPDDRTLVINWKSRLYLGNQLFFTYLMPLPSHILGDLYRSGDYETLNNHAYWNTGIVHLGPYKLVEFTRGDHAELQAFDDYFWGRPKVDRIIWRIITDSNTLLANVLTNEVDVTTRSALNLETAPIAEAQWASHGDGTVRYSPTSWTWLNPSGTNAIFGWEAPNQNLIRQAMYHAINRKEIEDTLGQGKEPSLDFPLAPGRPQFRGVDAAVKKYPYDTRRAEQLLADAAWRRAGDGTLVNDRGERFSVDFRSITRADQEQLQSAIAASLKQVGIDTQVNNITERQNGTPEFRNHWPGLYIGSHNIQVEDWRDRFHTVNIPSEATNWVGNNVAQWRNPAKDRLIDQFFDELQPQRQDQIMADYLRLFTEDLPHLPIKYNAEVTSYRSNVRNVPVRIESGGENARTWNAHLWEKD
jgi:peptide/nickel transport system substrate-binding protein